MRKLFFTLAFVLVTSIGFANENTINNSDLVDLLKISTIEKSDLAFLVKSSNAELSDYTIITSKIINEDYSCTEYHAIYYQGNFVGSFETIESGDDCGYTAHWL